MRETSSFLEFFKNLTSPAPESFPSTGSPAVAASVLIFDLHDFPLRLSCNLNCWLLPTLLHGSDNQSCLSNIFPSVSTPTLYSQQSKLTHPLPPPHSHVGCHLYSAFFPVNLICFANAKANTAEAPHGTDTSSATWSHSSLLTAFAGVWWPNSFLQRHTRHNGAAAHLTPA